MVDYNGNFVSFGSAAQPGRSADVNSGEGPEHAFDGNTATKWLSSQGGLGTDGVPSFVILNFSFVTSDGSATETSVAAYDFTTANDRPERDPVSWTIHCYDPTSDEWILHFEETDYTPPDDRYTSYGLFPSPPVPPSPPEPPSPPDPPASPPIPPGGPPPPRTGDGAGSAGDDPIFVGSDGVPYEVRGEAGWNFNLFSSPTLSINAAFEGVPERFRALDITETVLGSLSLAVCSADDALALRFDVSSGNLTVRDSSKRGHRSRQQSEVAMARAAASVVLERFECDLRLMSCRWVQRPVALAAALAEPLPLPLVDSGFSRVRVEATSATATVTRHCMLYYDVEIDCAAFARWQPAADACAALLHGTAADDVREQWVMILSIASGLAAGSRFYFMGLDVTNVVADTPADVHGLLGQRSFEAATDDGALAGASVGARGMPAPSFGPQGEGAIEGLYSDYRIGELDVHDSPWPFNRFTHCAGAREPTRAPAA